ncbi:unnamed protein product [Lampetra fluviatilis]
MELCEERSVLRLPPPDPFPPLIETMPGALHLAEANGSCRPPPDDNNDDGDDCGGDDIEAEEAGGEGQPIQGRGRRRLERLKRKLQQERYEYYNIPPKSDETLVVATRYALSCDVATNSIQPQELTMENPASDYNVIHVSFDGAFEEVFLTLTKRGQQEKNVWTRRVQWRDPQHLPETPLPPVRRLPSTL